jgi:hypothetical protein
MIEHVLDGRAFDSKRHAKDDDIRVVRGYAIVSARDRYADAHTCFGIVVRP